MAILGGSAEYYVKKFLNDLRAYVPEIESFRILWFDTVGKTYKDGKYLLNEGDLENLGSLPARLEELSKKGKSWIHISAEGKLNNETYLISISYNRESEGALATSINTSGPFINLDGSFNMNAQIKLID